MRVSALAQWSGAQPRILLEANATGQQLVRRMSRGRLAHVSTGEGGMNWSHKLAHLLMMQPCEVVSTVSNGTVWLATRCCVCGRISGKFASRPIPADSEFRP